MKINLPISVMRLIFETCKRNWESDSVRNLITLSNGKSMTKNMMTIDGEYPVYGANGIIGRTDKYLVEHPTITVGRVGSCGEINSTARSAWISDNAMWVSSISEAVDFSFMYYGLKSLDLSSGAKIAAMPSISQENVYRESLPVPPIETQKIIAQYLGQYTKNINPEHRVSLPESIKEIERTVERVEALATRIAKAQALREEASFEVDYLYGREIAELFTNANDWQTYNLGELTTDVSYGTSAKAHSMQIGTPVFRMGNIQSGKLDLSDMKYMHPSQQEIKKLTLQKGDILVNRTNSAELVGKCAVFDLDGDYLFASYIIRLRLDPQKANPYLVAEYINSPLGRAYMFAEKKQMTGQANVNSQKLRALPIKLPPLDEQRRIVAYLDSVQARLASLRELQSQTGEELDALLPSVLDRAFKGEL